ncbi:hypothetical protein GWI33_015697 [Rhynchophorus ferrugineus]|uniref:Uncharacterized protein n=1 Tax=Rhynchophorus ferrugineus TaxID=354439 RepID=A0A834M9H5_RHYFE|nr:hypothetical protein GWI33_015697 [Rhynchophorus ferrugineus]
MAQFYRRPADELSKLEDVLQSGRSDTRTNQTQSPQMRFRTSDLSAEGMEKEFFFYLTVSLFFSWNVGQNNPSANGVGFAGPARPPPPHAPPPPVPPRVSPLPSKP